MASAVQCARRVFLIAAALFLSCGLNSGRADAKTVTMQFQDLKILYTAAVAGTMSTSIDLVLQDANGNALSKFQVAVSAPGYTVVYAGNGTWKLTGNTADKGTTTIKIASVAAYKGNISLQSAIFLNGAAATGQGAVTGGKLAGDPTYEVTDAVTSSPDLTVEDLMFYEDHRPSTSPRLTPRCLSAGAHRRRTRYWTPLTWRRWTTRVCRRAQTTPVTFWPREKCSNKAVRRLSPGSSTATRQFRSLPLGP